MKQNVRKMSRIKKCLTLLKEEEPITEEAFKTAKGLISKIAKAQDYAFYKASDNGIFVELDLFVTGDDLEILDFSITEEGRIMFRSAEGKEKWGSL